MVVPMTINGQTYQISDIAIRLAARNATPERIKDYYVEVKGKQFPPKQLIRLVTKTPDPFNSANARSILTRLGFTVHHKT